MEQVADRAEVTTTFRRRLKTFALDPACGHREPGKQTDGCFVLCPRSPSGWHKSDSVTVTVYQHT